MSAPTAASHTLPLRNCYWVVPGLLLAGEHPNGATRDKTKERLKKLMGAGIECFVDLTKPTELLRYDTFLPFHVEYVRKAIKDHGLPSARSQMTEILEYIANAMRAGRPVYVHCRAGIGRTGTVVGCLLAERGALGNAAIDELNRLWQQNRRSRSWPFIPETDAQAKFVREWKPSMEGGFELSSLATAVATVGSMSADAGVRGTRAGVAGAGPGAGEAAGRSGGAGLRAAESATPATPLRTPASTVIDPTLATAVASELNSKPLSNTGVHSRTYFAWASVSGTNGQLRERRHCCHNRFNSSIAALPCWPRSARKQPTTVPVRPIPARQCTYTGRPARIEFAMYSRISVICVRALGSPWSLIALRTYST